MKLPRRLCSNPHVGDRKGLGYFFNFSISRALASMIGGWFHTEPPARGRLTGNPRIPGEPVPAVPVLAGGAREALAGAASDDPSCRRRIPYLRTSTVTWPSVPTT
jgi:hypothetical protein